MSDKIYNLIRIEEIAPGNTKFIHDMVKTFVDNVTAEIKRIGELKKAEDWKAIAEIAHKLVSNFAYLGADALHDVAGDIEKSVLYDGDVANIHAKVEQLCTNGMDLIAQLKEDFD
jgi:HPt (histidine-containing phosphotransfer) domain-containing protein